MNTCLYSFNISGIERERDIRSGGGWVSGFGGQENKKALDGEEVRRKKMGWREWQVNELEMEVGGGGCIEKRRGIMESLRGSWGVEGYRR